MSLTYASLNHALRVPLAAEVHSRPSLRLNPIESLTHLALMGALDGAQAVDNVLVQHQLLQALCQHFGVAAPGLDARYFFHDFGRFRLQWECHTEFATFTFAESRPENGTLADAFAAVPLRHIPEQWLATLHGRLMAAAHVVLNRAGRFDCPPQAELKTVLTGNVLVGSNALQGAEVWTDFAIGPDGFCRFVVQDVELSFQQSGRLVQRVLEIETYRMMALLGLPHAQRATPILNQIESELATLTVAMTDPALNGTPHPSRLPPPNQRVGAIPDPAVPAPTVPAPVANDEQVLLAQILDLAARMEKLALENNYRFSASAAYFTLVQSRIDSLREERIDGAPTIAEFMDRRLAPAMNTCAATARRQQTLGERIAHSNDLLRTKVGMVQERQNRKILESLDTRAAQQLRLQQAVEGLSVVAISYYSVGLLSYLGKAGKALGWQLNPDLFSGLLVPLMAGVVWFGLRRLHRHVGWRGKRA
jgi:uncharacterized membrane-anchored protein